MSEELADFILDVADLPRKQQPPIPLRITETSNNPKWILGKGERLVLNRLLRDPFDRPIAVEWDMDHPDSTIYQPDPVNWLEIESDKWTLSKGAIRNGIGNPPYSHVFRPSNLQEGEYRAEQLIGREREIETISGRVKGALKNRSDGENIIILTGRRGCGKTLLNKKILQDMGSMTETPVVNLDLYYIREETKRLGKVDMVSYLRVILQAVADSLPEVSNICLTALRNESLPPAVVAPIIWSEAPNGLIVALDHMDILSLVTDSELRLLENSVLVPLILQNQGVVVGAARAPRLFLEPLLRFATEEIEVEPWDIHSRNLVLG